MRVPYNGGPVVSCPVVYASFWGSLWPTKPDAVAAQAILTTFLGDLVHSTWMNVLSQYGVKGGMFAQANNLILPQDPKGFAQQDGHIGVTLSTSDCEQNLLGMVSNRMLPAPSDPRNTPPVVICFLNDNVTTDLIERKRTEGIDVHGYHEHLMTAGGQPLIYAIVKWRPPKEAADINAMTGTASHELAEMATNPLGSGRPGDPLNGWIIPAELGSTEGSTEICDQDNGLLCRGGIQELAGTSWMVSPMWSDVDDTCTASASNPIPPIHPGPFSLSATIAAEPRRDSQLLQRLTPFPTMHKDPETNRTYMKKSEVFAYYRKLFYPIRHERVHPDFPAFLRELALILETEARIDEK